MVNGRNNAHRVRVLMQIPLHTNKNLLPIEIHNKSMEKNKNDYNVGFI